MSRPSYHEEPVDISDVMPWWHRAWRRHGEMVVTCAKVFVAAAIGAAIMFPAVWCACESLVQR